MNSRLHSDYSTVGRTNSWNAGGEWSVTPGIKFRASRAQSTRAPNINYLYQAPSQYDETDASTHDPIGRRYYMGWRVRL